MPGTARRRRRARIIRNSILEGNSFTVIVLVFFTALVVGGLLNAFTNTTVLHAWGNFFSAPGHAIAAAWDTAVGAYVEMFEGSIFNPHTVAALFQQASIGTAIHDGYLSAVFYPLSETCVQATPLILAGLAVALPYQAGLFNIGAQSQFIGGAIVATYLGYGVSLPFVRPRRGLRARRFRRRRGARLAGRRAQGPDRRARGDHHDHAQLHHGLLPDLPALLRLPDAGAGTRATRSARSSPADAHLPHLFGPHLRINVGFLIALACAAGMWWLLNRTTTGFEFRSIGKNPSAARVAGMNVGRNWVLVMLIAGGLAGLAAPRSSRAPTSP